ncbi:hypothetical protein [Sorangium sp. So ce426]|uniref:hypothetical protein n=1 Tax=Sorangium sp. So ce426 TaxID=3133312 RepID=UPI003F5C0E25
MPVSMTSDDILALRHEILSCNHCFKGSKTARGCWHHEDILGGYEPGKILVLTINAQRPFDPAWEDERYRPQANGSRGGTARAARRDGGLAIYQQIRDEDNRRKLRFADESLAIFAGADPGEFAPWVAKHPGHKKWLSAACKLLLGSNCDTAHKLLAKHFTFLDIYKRATANEEHLDRVAQEHPLAECPGRWLNRQIDVLRPALVLLCGRTVIARANALWGVGGRDLQDLSKVGAVHGKSWLLQLPGGNVECWTAYGIAGWPAQLCWPKATGTNALQRAIQRVIDARVQRELRQPG